MPDRPHAPRTKLDVRGGVRLAVTVLLANTVLLAVFGSTSAAVLGSFAVVIHLYFLDFDGDRRERLTGHGTATLVGLLAVAVGTWTAHPLWLAVVAAFAVSAAFAFARVFRGYAARSAVGLQGAFFLPLMIPATTTELPGLLGAWLVGSAFALVAAVVLPHRRSGDLRRAVADWLTAVAGLAGALGRREPLAAPTAAVRVADQSLIALLDAFPMRPGAVGRRQRALDELAARAQWSMPVVAMLEPLPAGDDPTLADVSTTAFAQAATLVRDGTPPAQPADVEAARNRDLDRLATQPLADLQEPDLRAHEPASLGQSQALRAHEPTSLAQSQALRAHYVARLLSIAAGMDLWLAGLSRGLRMPKPGLGSVADETPAALLRQALRPGSVWLWNAVRTGLATAACVLLVRELGVAHGLWVVIVALSCIQGSFSARGATRGMVAMAGGAAAGVVLAGALLAAHPPYAVFVVLLPVTAFLAKAVATRGPFVAQVAYTPFALVNVAVLGWPTQPGLAAVRVEDVALGAVVAVVATVAIFPAGLRRLIQRRADAAGAQSAAYLDAAIAAARGGAPVAPDARRACVSAIAAYESTLAAASVQRPASRAAVAQVATTDALARDRLVGGDACADLAVRRAADPAMVPVADACAAWWADEFGHMR